MSVSMRSILEQIGFAEDWTTITDQAPGYRFNAGNLRIQATQVTSEYLRPEFLITGIEDQRPRALGSIQLSMPIAVESFEQGVAWIAYAVSARFQPTKPIAWLEQGRLWKHHLPWEQKQAAFRARPHCSVARDWFRLPAKTLVALSLSAPEQAAAVFTFDGNILTILAGDARLPMPATGTAWTRDYAVRLASFKDFPKRLMRADLDIGVWEGKLNVDRARFDLFESAEPKP